MKQVVGRIRGLGPVYVTITFGRRPVVPNMPPVCLLIICVLSAMSLSTGSLPSSGVRSLTRPCEVSSGTAAMIYFGVPLVPLERDFLQDYWVSGLCPSSGIPTTHLRKEIDQVSQTSCSFCSCRIPGDGQSPKASSRERYTPSSEPFRIYQ
jgi:hypothetical protein